VLPAAAVVAHQGGWDEILMVVGPLAAIAALLVVAKRRATQLGQVPAGTDPSGRDGADSGPLDVGTE
jgi:hypothetical protein